jgi:hypothetical protein
VAEHTVDASLGQPAAFAFELVLVVATPALVGRDFGVASVPPAEHQPSNLVSVSNVNI